MVDAHLTCKVDACQHDVLGVMIEGATAKVEAFEECQGCALHFGLEAKCPRQLLAELLHLGLIEFAELGLIVKRDGAQFLACAIHNIIHAWYAFTCITTR